MEAFIGTWKNESSEDFDKIMERLKVNPELRKMGNTIKPNFIISDMGGGKYNMRLESSVKIIDTTFKLGEKFKEVTPDSREVTSLITLDHNVLKQEQVGPDRTVYIDREVDGNTMKMIVKVDELVSTRTYSKVA
ncbi:unnamed protein product [Hydatigera taeniaeformis]|uniref:FABP domain-containing protein n=1 Tax=Hydatigena taeniaeformis TaxID=6205 RepID=A0A0R3X9K4_HYDTA|nr:unnamed protein product [Hydatigera taeniaeformis]